MAWEDWRRREVNKAIEFLHGRAQLRRIIEINQQVVRWKLEHPELVKDEVPW